jgi:hypothetical protein
LPAFWLPASTLNVMVTPGTGALFVLWANAVTV